MITWIQIKGIPMHCWNCTTFKRILELEGTLLSLGENATGKGDCDTVNVLISTKQLERIEETIKLEVGRDIFLVRVEELGLHDQGSRHQNQSTRVFSSKVTISDSEENSSEGSSDSRQSNSKPYRSKTKGHEPMLVEDEVIKSTSLEIREKDDAYINEHHLSRNIGEFEMVGCYNNFEKREMENFQILEDIPINATNPHYPDAEVGVGHCTGSRSIVQMGNNPMEMPSPLGLGVFAPPFE
ncbi:hypothetical protein V6N13_142009 [Hibiscus sabdariffa]